MSYILDALKKIEQEKSRKVRPDGRVSISGDLFQDRKQSVGKGGFWKIAAIVLFVSVAASAGTWFLFHDKGNRNPTPVRARIVPSPAPASKAPLPPAVPEPVKPQPVPAAVPPAAIPAKQDTIVADAEENPSPRKIRRVKKQITPQAASPKRVESSVPAPADIKLSGIAWQEERAARRAVVNGFLLKEGAVVSGAKITDIKADRVRFSTSAGNFDIRLDAVLPEGGQR